MRLDRRVLDTEALFLIGSFDLSSPHGGDRHGLTEGIEQLQLAAGFLSGWGIVVLDQGGDVCSAQAVCRDVRGQDDVGKEFLFMKTGTLPFRLPVTPPGGGGERIESRPFGRAPERWRAACGHPAFPPRH
jgi:hypothetical protein